ncbi:oxidoreductase, partial [Paenarthrobacter nicotinovorans]
MEKLGSRTRGTHSMAALAGVVSAGVVLAVAELIGAFFTARATPFFALGSTFIDFTPPWLKDFAIATFGTNDKAALFVGMGVTIAVLACVLGIVAYRKWALGVLGVLFMGAVIVACVLTRAGVGPLNAIPSILGTLAGLFVLRRLMVPLWGLKPWPEAPADQAADAGDHLGSADAGTVGTSRRRFF